MMIAYISTQFLQCCEMILDGLIVFVGLQGGTIGLLVSGTWMLDSGVKCLSVLKCLTQLLNMRIQGYGYFMYIYY